MGNASQPGALTKAYRTVRPRYHGRPDVEMNTIGWAIFLGVLILLVPLVPLLLAYWVVGKVIGLLTPRRGAENEVRREDE